MRKLNAFVTISLLSLIVIFSLPVNVFKSTSIEEIQKPIPESLKYLDITTLPITPINFELGTVKTDLTLVSAFFDIKRIGRPNSDYFKWLAATFKLNNPFVVFTQEKYKQDIIKLIPANRQVLLVFVELQDLPYYSYIENIKQVVMSRKYQASIEYPHRIECTNPLYSIVIFSKFNFLDSTANLNPFRSSRFVWVDAGLSRFFGDFDLAIPLTGQKIPDGKLFTVLHDDAYTNEHYNNKNRSIIYTANNWILTGAMGGTKSAIAAINKEIHEEWKAVLSKNVVNNEQILLNLVLFRLPELFYIFVYSHTNVDCFRDALMNLV